MSEGLYLFPAAMLAGSEFTPSENLRVDSPSQLENFVDSDCGSDNLKIPASEPELEVNIKVNLSEAKENRNLNGIHN